MSAHTPLSRRELLRLTAAGGALASMAPFAAAVAQESPPVPPKSAVRNIIFMVSDGMSLGVPSLAESFSRLTRSRGTHWNRLLIEPTTTLGFFETHSLSSLVTDSAAASSAWSSGSRVFNASINVLPDGTKLTPVASVVGGIGKRVGLVTTTTITHATPAGFATVQPHRDDEHLIAPQYLGGVDVLLGGGREFFDAAFRADKTDVISTYTSKGYSFWERRDQVNGTDRPAKVLGLFSKSHIPFTIDRENDPALLASVPTLAEMSRAALDILDRAPNGFLLQIEGGRVDHAAHLNDAAAIFRDQLAFDDAIGVVLDFIAKRDDTLVVITSDHGNSNPGLNGMGHEYKNSTECFEKLALATGSFERIAPDLARVTPGSAAAGDKSKERPAPSVDDTIAIVRRHTSFEIHKKQAVAIAEASVGRPAGPLNKHHLNFEGVLGEVLSNYNGIGWTSINHTADWAPILAVGSGREQFFGLVRNADAFPRMLALFGTSHTNPAMTLEDAKKYAVSTPHHPSRPHWI